MRFFILFVSLFLFPFYLIAQSSSSQADVTAAEQEIRYISDELYIFLHAGPGRDFRIVGSINAGTTVSLLQVERKAGYAQVQDERERVGWVESRFVSRTPSIRTTLDDATDRLKSQQEDIKAMQQRMNIAISDFALSEQQKIALNRKLTHILEQNAELERRIIKKERSDQMQWFTRGTVLGLISVTIGYLLGLFGRKKAQSNSIS
ncbi:TIGR04211 family SH3 domain-containing protein [Glaciecola sp. 33A]|jgi:SH3 domain protein|uniref:TIGR04211 family SH3 domain-containing protein n=1 Tax=Glaciecola sp. 33A TaxID=2057807 RepID=UPI000C322056|nr:TIGR04211 family SH3 domain-containing protein [Glaciecola sp. 33A]PKI00866.1 TIGR04211 family SH3 domain-containing protein [Glaciecola sp. 33A]